MRAIALFFTNARRVWRRLRMLLLKPLFGKYGANFIFDPDGLYTYRNIFIGDHVSLGYRPILIAELSEIRVGSYVMFGPEVVVIGGGHNTTVIGRRMSRVHEKTGNEDLGVVIEDDVWVGARAVLLRGVCVGRGAIIGAGAVVTKSVPPYSVVGGNPASVLRFRWDVKTILQHEKLLYKKDDRLKRDYLESTQREMRMLTPKRQSCA